MGSLSQTPQLVPSEMRPRALCWASFQIATPSFNNYTLPPASWQPPETDFTPALSRSRLLPFPSKQLDEAAVRPAACHPPRPTAKGWSEGLPGLSCLGTCMTYQLVGGLQSTGRCELSRLQLVNKKHVS